MKLKIRFLLLLSVVALLGLLSSGTGQGLSTGFKCSIDSGCKYAQGKVEWDAANVLTHSWWGSTASGTCDPTNNITRWKLISTAVYNDATGAQVFLHASGIWRTNCEIVNNDNPPYAWVVNVNVAKPANPSSHFWWQHDPPGIDFYPYVRRDY